MYLWMYVYMFVWLHVYKGRHLYVYCIGKDSRMNLIWYRQKISILNDKIYKETSNVRKSDISYLTWIPPSLDRCVLDRVFEKTNAFELQTDLAWWKNVQELVGMQFFPFLPNQAGSYMILPLHPSVLIWGRSLSHDITPLSNII